MAVRAGLELEKGSKSFMVFRNLSRGRGGLMETQERDHSQERLESRDKMFLALKLSRDLQRKLGVTGNVFGGKIYIFIATLGKT